MKSRILIPLACIIVVSFMMVEPAGSIEGAPDAVTLQVTLQAGIQR